MASCYAGGLHNNLSTTAIEQQHWDRLVGQFRQVCLLRRQRKLIESDMILNSDLPRTIASWSQSYDAEPSAKKSRLDAMFQAEQRRIDDAWLVQELMTARFNEHLIPAICMQVVQEVRMAVAEEMAAQKPSTQAASAREFAAAGAGRAARVAFDDIPGVIDLVLAEEQNRANARQLESAVCP